MPRVIRTILILIPLGIVVAAVGVWINNSLKKPAEVPPPEVQVGTHHVDGITFEAEHLMQEGVNLMATSGPHDLHLSRRGDILNYYHGQLTINDISLPDVKSGDTVRWNLSGPVLVNGQPVTPHPLQPTRIDADFTEFDWLARESPAPRDTLSVAWLGVSRKFVAAHGDGAIRIWDSDRHTVQQSIIPDVPNHPKARGGYGLRADPSPDGLQIVATNIYGEEVTLWNAETGAKVASYTSEPKGRVTQVAFASPDSILEARGTHLRLRPLSGMTTATEVGTVHDQFEPPFAVHPRAVVVAWNDGQKLHFGPLSAARFERDSTSSGQLAFSPDGSRLAEYDGHLRLAILDVKSGQELKRLRWRLVPGEISSIQCLAFSPDGQTLAVGSTSSIRFYDVASGRERGGLACPWVRAIAYSADGRSLIAALQKKPGLRMWETVDLVVKNNP